MAARADGFEFACRIDAIGELDERLKAFVDFEGSAFLEVMIDQNAEVYPLVRPGQGYANMITGPFIPSRAGEQAGSEGAGRHQVADMV